MDDEDVADAEDARKLQTADSFVGFGTASEYKPATEPIMDILKTTGDTMGIKLLRRMGWRDGQGVGPRVRRKARLDEEDEPGGENGQEMHLFAPDDSQMISFVKKNDRKGLGFEGEGRLAEALGNPADSTPTAHIENNGDEDIGIGTRATSTKSKKKKQASRGGFGVGILNDTGSDEEDPYHMGPQISYNRTIGADKKKKKLESVKTAANPLLRSKPVFISKKIAATKATSTFRRCHDGRLPLDGFVLSSNPDPLSSILSQDGKYPPPTIPQDWKSSISKTAQPTSSTPSIYRSPASVAKASTLDPKSRASLLGETLLPGKSVFDFLNATARSRIATATNNPHLPPALNEASASSLSSQDPKKTLQSLVPALSPATALTALSRGTAGWLPYAEDPPKRTRYQLFLSTIAGLREPGSVPDRAPGASTDDWVKEMNEFAHAAQIFKPMTGMMATRFTSSSSAPALASDNLNPHKGAAGEEQEKEELVTSPVEKAKDPGEEAAAVGMYGPLTRSRQEFYPTRLLCKRFNVKPPSHVQVDPPPNQDTEIKGPPVHSTALPTKKLELVGKAEMENLRREGGFAECGEGLGEGEREKVERRRVVVDPERNEALEGERPGDAVFRAVFGSDEEDE